MSITRTSPGWWAKTFAKLLVVFSIAPCLFAKAADAPKGVPRVLFLGDSLTAGYGLSLDEAFPAKVGAIARSQGYDIEVSNGGASGDTTDGALRRLAWLLKKPVNIVVIALGGNDGLRGLDLQTSKTNLTKIVEKIRSSFPSTKIMLMQMELPPNLGADYTKEFREIFPAIAEAQKITLGAFLLKGVAGDVGLNQADRMHPNARGQEIIAQTVWEELKPLLEKS